MVLRNEIQQNNIATNDWQGIVHPSHYGASSIECNGLGLQDPVGLCAHRPELLTVTVVGLRNAQLENQVGKELLRRSRRRVNDQQIGRAQVGPGSLVHTPVGRLRRFSQAGHNTYRHLGTSTVQDRLVERQANALPDSGQDLIRQILITVLDGGVRDRDVPADFVPVNFELVEHDVHLVEVAHHLGPNAFRDGPKNVLPGGSADRL